MQLYQGDDAYVDKNTVSPSLLLLSHHTHRISPSLSSQSLHHYFEELIGLSVSVFVTRKPLILTCYKNCIAVNFSMLQKYTAVQNRFMFPVTLGYSKLMLTEKMVYVNNYVSVCVPPLVRRIWARVCG